MEFFAVLISDQIVLPSPPRSSLFCDQTASPLRRDLGSSVVNLRPTDFKGEASPFFPQPQTRRFNVGNHGSASSKIWRLKD
jgi:hypothetical protein